jgi:uncharacterized protein (TIRG00374 family)
VVRTPAWHTAPSMAESARGPWRIVWRIVLLAIGGLSLYLLAPKLIDIFTSWPDLKTLKPEWVGLAVLFEAMSYISLWQLQRIALRATSWFAVGTAQLASGAAGSIIPGGAATAGAIGYRMFVRAGIRPGDVAAGLAATTVATTATILALPLLALPAVIGGVAAPHGLVEAAYIGIAGFVAVAIVAALAFAWDGPLVLVGRAARWILRRTPKRDGVDDLPNRLLEQRDRLLRTFGKRWHFALAGAVGKAGFDYAALICCLAAVGARPDPSLVLLAYVAGALLAMIPVTPGGLGFVEAGLSGMLVLAGVSGQQALVGTLAYRLVSFWLPLPIGGIAYLLFRRRYGSTGASSASTTSP